MKGRQIPESEETELAGLGDHWMEKVRNIEEQDEWFFRNKTGQLSFPYFLSVGLEVMFSLGLDFGIFFLAKANFLYLHLPSPEMYTSLPAKKNYLHYLGNLAGTPNPLFILYPTAQGIRLSRFLEIVLNST